MINATSHNTSPKVIAVVMGVSGSGKTVVGTRLARILGVRFAEGDQFHPPENIARMSAGMPLRDEDRWGWLDAIALEIDNAERLGDGLVIACSALKRAYRERLRHASPYVRFVYLDTPRPVAAARVASRKDHFMPPSLVASQFAALEPPCPDEDAIVLDATADVAGIVLQTASRLGTQAGIAR